MGTIQICPCLKKQKDEKCQNNHNENKVYYEGDKDDFNDRPMTVEKPEHEPCSGDDLYDRPLKVHINLEENRIEQSNDNDCLKKTMKFLKIICKKKKSNEEIISKINKIKSNNDNELDNVDNLENNKIFKIDRKAKMEAIKKSLKASINDEKNLEKINNACLKYNDFLDKIRNEKIIENVYIIKSSKIKSFNYLLSSINNSENDSNLNESKKIRGHRKVLELNSDDLIIRYEDFKKYINLKEDSLSLINDEFLNELDIKPKEFGGTPKLILFRNKKRYEVYFIDNNKIVKVGIFDFENNFNFKCRYVNDTGSKELSELDKMIKKEKKEENKKESSENIEYNSKNGGSSIDTDKVNETKIKNEEKNKDFLVEEVEDIKSSKETKKAEINFSNDNEKKDLIKNNNIIDDTKEDSKIDSKEKTKIDYKKNDIIDNDKETQEDLIDTIPNNNNKSGSIIMKESIDKSSNNNTNQIGITSSKDSISNIIDLTNINLDSCHQSNTSMVKNEKNLNESEKETSLSKNFITPGEEAEKYHTEDSSYLNQRINQKTNNNNNNDIINFDLDEENNDEKEKIYFKNSLYFYGQFKDIYNQYETGIDSVDKFKEFYLINSKWVTMFKTFFSFKKIVDYIENIYKSQTKNFDTFIDKFTKYSKDQKLYKEFLDNFQNYKDNVNKLYFKFFPEYLDDEIPIHFQLIREDVFARILSSFNMNIINKFDKHKYEALIGDNLVILKGKNKNKKEGFNYFICEFQKIEDEIELHVEQKLYYKTENLFEREFINYIYPQGLITYFQMRKLKLNIKTEQDIIDNEEEKIGTFINLSDKKLDNNSIFKSSIMCGMINSEESKFSRSNTNNKDDISNTNSYCLFMDRIPQGTQKTIVEDNKKLMSNLKITLNSISKKKINTIQNNPNKKNQKNEEILLLNDLHDESTPLFVRQYKTQPLVSLINNGSNNDLICVLRCLSNIDLFTDYFFTFDKIILELRMLDSEADYKLSLPFYEAIQKLWGTNEKSCDPQYIRNALINLNPTFEGFVLNDLKVLITTIYENLHSELNKKKNVVTILTSVNQLRKDEVLQNFRNYYYNSNDSEIQDIFYFEQGNYIKCKNCTVKKYNYFLNHSIVFPLDEIMLFHNKQNKKNVELSIEECFIYYLSEKDMLKGNQIYCSECGNYEDGILANLLNTCPEILTIIIQNKIRSNTNIILQFQFELDMSYYVFDKTKSKSTSYNLIGAIFKNPGSNISEKYISYCKSPVDQKWYLYTDSNITLCENISNYTNFNGKPLVLFYQKAKKKENKNVIIGLNGIIRLNTKEINLNFKYNNEIRSLKVFEDSKFKNIMDKIYNLFLLTNSMKMNFYKTSNEIIDIQKTIKENGLEDNSEIYIQ